MSFFKGFELLDHPCSALLYRESAVWCPRSTPPLFADDDLHCALDLLIPSTPCSLDLLLDAAASDLFIASSAAAFRRIQERAETKLQLQSLSERVAALELGFDQALRSRSPGFDRTYKWTTEIKGAKGEGFDRKYRLTAVVKAGEQRSVKWTAEIKGKGKGKEPPVTRTYTFQASSAPAAKAQATDKKKKDKEKEKKEEEKKKGSCSTKRIVEIEDEAGPGAIVIRKAFTKRSVDRSKGKRKEISPQDAALIIQLSFRSYLLRRSQVLRALRELAVAKAKLKEIRAWFLNFSYRRRVAKDAEEQQRFSEKIIVLLLTVESIEGPDYMVRAAKKSMVEELEAMLAAIDPQPAGKLASFKRRKFDLPEGGISKEISVGVTEVVQMLEEEDDDKSV